MYNNFYTITLHFVCTRNYEICEYTCICQFIQVQEEMADLLSSQKAFDGGTINDDVYRKLFGGLELGSVKIDNLKFEASCLEIVTYLRSRDQRYVQLSIDQSDKSNCNFNHIVNV